MDRASLVAQTSQVLRMHLPMQEMRVQSLAWEYPLAKEMATHSSILAWVDWWAAVHWVAKELDMTWWLNNNKQQQNGQPRRNGQISRNVYSLKTESRRNIIYEQTDSQEWNWTIKNKQTKQQQKKKKITNKEVYDQMAS